MHIAFLPQLLPPSISQVTHMPPELLRDGQLSKAVDVYAFGVLLWEMCVETIPVHPVLNLLTPSLR
jgi:serine/threonine protein kinase